VFSFTVHDSVDSFSLGELSGYAKNLLGLALGGSNNEVKISAKVDTEATGERIYRLILSFPNGGDIGSLINGLQLGESYLGEVSLSHRFGDEGQADVPVKGKFVVKTDVSRAYLQGVLKEMNIIAPFALMVNNFSFGLAFDDLKALQKMMPDELGDLNLSSLGVITKDLNQLVAAGLKAEDTPAPIKETFFSVQSLLKGIHEISLFAGDHCISLRFEGFELNKIFLSKEELQNLDVEASSGGLFSKLKMPNPWQQGKERRCLLFGLDAGGKTTTLYKLKLGEIVTTIPTIGFNVESVKYKNTNFTFWDVGGQPSIRALWRHYLANTNALIFVVDSNDRERLQEAHEELHKVLSEAEVADAALLVFANKQDLPNAASVAEITDKLGLHSLRNRKWYIQATCSTSGDGLYEGLDWLQAALN